VSEPAPNFQRQKTAALYALMGVSLIVGLLEGLLAPHSGSTDGLFPLQLFGSLAMLLAGFYWLHYDARELAIQRPAWLNVGIIMLAIVFVPYYLFKTRPAGRRWRAILGFLGIVLGSLVVSAIGATFALNSSGVSGA
jgi:hypothetical protein